MQHLNVRPLSSLPLVTPDIEASLLHMEGLTNLEGHPCLNHLCHQLDGLGLLEQSRPFLPSLVIPILVVPDGVTIEPHKELVAIWSQIDEAGKTRLRSEIESNSSYCESDQNVEAHCRRILSLAKSVTLYNRAMQRDEDTRNVCVDHMLSSGWHFHNDIAESAKGFGLCQEWASVAECVALLINPRYKDASVQEMVCKMIQDGDLEEAQGALDRFEISQSVRSRIFDALVSKVRGMLAQHILIIRDRDLPDRLGSAIEEYCQFAAVIADPIVENRTQAFGIIAYWRSQIAEPAQQVERQALLEPIHPEVPLQPVVAPAEAEASHRAEIRAAVIAEIEDLIEGRVAPQPTLTLPAQTPLEEITGNPEALDQERSGSQEAPPLSICGRLLQGVKEFGSWVMDGLQTFMAWLRSYTLSINSNVGE